MAGFTSPGVLFAGNSYSPERRFYRLLLGKLREAGYTRFVEPCAGSFAVSVIATDVGWKPSEIEASDVALFPAILGSVLSGTPLETLDVRVDGEPLALPEDPTAAAAEIMWTQLLLRLKQRPDVPYWQQITRQVEDDRERITGDLMEQMKGVRARLDGLQYRSADLVDHIREVAQDPHTVIVAAPPTYTAGFEKFYDTGGQMTWAEPEYAMFDPDIHNPEIMDELADAPALLLLYHEAEIGTGIGSDRAVFARPGPKGKNAYIRSNRPAEVFQHTGGLRVDPKYAPDLEPSPYPMLPPTHEITRDSTVQLVRVKPNVAEWYRRRWMHRLAEGMQSGTILVLIDGYVAGTMAFDTKMVSYFGNSSRILLSYCLGPDHPGIRLTRLMLMIARQYSTALTAINPSAHLYVAGSSGILTTNFTKYPEAKQMRGLFSLTNRKKGPDGYSLIYEADWPEPKSLPQILGEFLDGEEKYQRERAKQQQIREQKEAQA